MSVGLGPWQSHGEHIYQDAIAAEAKRASDREMLIRTLRYILQDEPTGIPRATSYCRFVIREALEAVGETA